LSAGFTADAVPVDIVSQRKFRHFGVVTAAGNPGGSVFARVSCAVGILHLAFSRTRTIKKRLLYYDTGNFLKT
jgi:hypothetical protein